MTELPPHSRREVGYLRVLSNRNFLLIWLAQIAGQVAYYITFAMLIVLVFKLTERNFAVASLNAMFILPAIALGAYGGVFSDRHDKRAVLFITNFLRAATLLFLLLVVLSTGSVPLIYLAAALFAVVSQFFIPAEISALPRLVPKSELLKANSLFTLTLYGSILTGFSSGSYLFDKAGDEKLPLTLAIALFLTASVLVYFLPKMKGVPVKQRIREVFADIARELAESLKFVFERKKLRVPLTEITISQVILGVMVALSPSFILNIAKLPIEKAWIVIVPAGLGMLAGAIGIGYLAQRRSRELVTKTALLALGLTTLAVSSISFIGSILNISAPSNAFSMLIGAMLFLVGASISSIFVPAQTSLQVESAEHERGRVFGILNMVINVSAILPILLAGLLADTALSVTQVMFGFAVVVVAWALYEFIAFKPRFEVR